MAQNYMCKLVDGSVITIENVARAEKDGSGRRFFNEDGETICAFDDGQSVAHWPVGSSIEAPPAPPESPEPVIPEVE